MRRRSAAEAPSASQVERLQKALSGRLQGEARFDRLSRTIYATDASLYQIFPIGVAYPRDVEDVAAIVRACGDLDIPIIPRGAGTGIAGGAVGAGLQIDFSRFMHQIVCVDPERRSAVVQPGVVLDDLNRAAAPFGLQFPPDVATGSRATIGGMIANNSCGAHSVLYGRTVDYVSRLTAVLSDGSIVNWTHNPFAELTSAETTPARPHTLPVVPRSSREATIIRELSEIRDQEQAEVFARFPRVMRRDGGYALDRLCTSDQLNPATMLIGSEGTLAVIAEAQLRLVPLPKHRALLVAAFDHVLDAIAATTLVLEHNPAAVELVDHRILSAGAAQIDSAVREAVLPEVPPAVLYCELYDDHESVLRDRLAALDRSLANAGVTRWRKQVTDSSAQLAAWTLRNKGFGFLTSRPGPRQPHEFIEDAAVPPHRLRDYIAELGAALTAEGVSEVAYYAHASVGVIHVRPVLSLFDPADVLRMRRIAIKTCDLVLKYGGAMTGEHGDGLVRSEWAGRMFGERLLYAFERVKTAFDPQNIFNPGKIVGAASMIENLRPHQPPTSLPRLAHFDYGAHGDLAGLANMCTGVGQCRQKQTGTMCPSYMATLDEMHTTRARANALRVALQYPSSLHGLDDPSLADAMELCLSCKACKTECPTGVDMARLKAEWLAHRNTAAGASATARCFAAAPAFSAIGSYMPALSNWLGQSQFARRLLDRWLNIDARVPPPSFAKQTFRAWFRRHKPPRHFHQDRDVVYIVDTWTNAYWPAAGIAAVRLLESIGYRVVVPPLRCCGRPLISEGFLDDAAALARTNVDLLTPYLRRGCPIVGTEPSCISAYRDEYPHFVRTDAARELAEAVCSVEAVLVESGAVRPRTAGAGSVLYHGHCHQKALWGTGQIRSLAQRLGVPLREIDSGCCGMAGSFGHDRRHYDVATAIGAQRLFPAIRSAPKAEVLVSGFSCREQIAHHCGRVPRHVLEAFADALCPHGS